jgi:hypothetical protein
VNNGADLEIETNQGETPLYWAVAHGDTRPVLVLLKAGAKIVPALLALARNGYHSNFHRLLYAGISNAETASLTWFALRSVPFWSMGYVTSVEARFHSI